MRLVIIRHADAEARSGSLFSKKRDANRRLTENGRKEMRKNARALRALAPAIDLLATSPLVRARETAEIVAAKFDLRDTVEQPLLEPDADKAALIDWLGSQPAEATIAIVGHEPHLSALAGLLIAGKEKSVIALKKGACCLIEFEGRPGTGSGTLLWLLQPAQLRKIDA